MLRRDRAQLFTSANVHRVTETPRAIPASGVFARPEPQPMAYEVRAVKHGFGVFIEGRERPLTVHPTIEHAIALAESLARRCSTPVHVRES